jgi:hypothetical protein
MSKCHVRELSNVYRALFQDALCTFPTLGAEFEKDLNRLERLVEQRGLPFLLVDLPAAGKHLDRCLADGQYKLSGLPATSRFSGRAVIPKFLRGLYLLVFHESGLLREDYSVEAIFFLRQLLFVGKKTSIACSHAKVEDEVLEFVVTDSQLPEPEGFWTASTPSDLAAPVPYQGFGSSQLLRDRIESYDPVTRVELTTFLTMLDSVSNIVTTTLGVYDPADWRFKHGPGAIAESVGPSNKYYWKNWSHALESGYPLADFGFHSHSSWADRCMGPDEIGSNEPSSRLVAVPKTYSGPRLIAAEPSEHQWCQQNCWDYFSSRTRRSWLRGFVAFRDQTLNQRLCTKASETGSLATVDLSAASDRVTCHVAGQFFRGNPGLLRALRASRTRRVRQQLTRKASELVELRKFSTMGNANTFPVESLVFLGIALAAVATVRGFERLSSRKLESLLGEVAVFGDDIVIPSDSRELFVRALEVLYFKVNDAKSFWTGKFRESCGVDSYNGVNVTPVYWRRPYDGGPESLASVVECRNNFYQKFLLNTAAYLASTLPKDIPMVAMSSGVFGMKTRFRPDNSGLPRRYCQHLQRVEVKAQTMISSQSRTPTNDDTALLQYFTEEPSPDNIWVHGVPQRPVTRVRRRWVPEELLSAQ